MRSPTPRAAAGAALARAAVHDGELPPVPAPSIQDAVYRGASHAGRRQSSHRHEPAPGHRQRRGRRQLRHRAARGPRQSSGSTSVPSIGSTWSSRSPPAPPRPSPTPGAARPSTPRRCAGSRRGRPARRVDCRRASNPAPLVAAAVAFDERAWLVRPGGRTGTPVAGRGRRDRELRPCAGRPRRRCAALALAGSPALVDALAAVGVVVTRAGLVRLRGAVAGGVLGVTNGFCRAAIRVVIAGGGDDHVRRGVRDAGTGRGVGVHGDCWQRA